MSMKFWDKQDDMFKQPLEMHANLELPSFSWIQLEHSFEIPQDPLWKEWNHSHASQQQQSNSTPNFTPQTNQQKLTCQASSLFSVQDAGFKCEGQAFQEGSQLQQYQIRNKFKRMKIIKKSPPKVQRRTKRKIFRGSLDQNGGQNLKSVSFEVYQVIKKLKHDQKILSNELVQRILVKSLPNERKDKNIRRRFYDSINVLNAIGIIQKSGSKSDTKRGVYTSIRSIQKKEEQLQSLESLTSKIQERIKNKNEEKKELLNKLQNLNNLISYAKDLSNSQKSENKDSIINFPLSMFEVNYEEVDRMVDSHQQLILEGKTKMISNCDIMKKIIQVRQQAKRRNKYSKKRMQKKEGNLLLKIKEKKSSS